MIMRPLNSQTLFYAALALFILVPLLARWTQGVTPFTLMLRLAQKFALGVMSLLFACLPGMSFTDDQGGDVPAWSGRVLFGLIGLLFIGTGIRTLLRWRSGLPYEDFDNHPD